MNQATHLPSRWRQFNVLTKPRVIQLIVFCALIGMVLAVPGWPSWADVRLAGRAGGGSGLVAGAAAAVAGQNLGAKQPDRAARAGDAAAKIGLVEWLSTVTRRSGGRSCSKNWLLSSVW